MANFELGNLIWRVRGDSTDFDKQIGGAQTRMDKFGDRARKVGANLTKFVTLPLAALGGVAVKAASDLGESLNAVNVVFGDAAGTIEDFGETASEAAGLSQNSFNELATVIGAQLKQSGLDIGTVADQTVELTQRSADLASVFNVDVKEATGALGAALRGEAEPARRFGVNISDAAVQAEALASGLVETKDQITEQIKVQARYNLIMQQSEQVAGDFENTSDNLANQTRILKANLENVGAELGQAFLPLVTDVVKGVGDAVRLFSNLDDGTKKLITTLAVIAAASGPIIGMVGAVGKLKLAITALNTAALLGPAGIIAAVAGLSAGLYLLGRRMIQTTRETRDFAEIAQDIGDAQLDRSLEALNKELATGSDQWVKNYTEADRWAAATRDLLNEYGNLEDTLAGTLTTAQKKRLSDALATEDADVLRAVLEDLIVARGGETEASIAAAEAAEQEAAAREIAAAQAEAQREIANQTAADARSQAEQLYRSLLNQLEVETEIERIEADRSAALSELADDYVRTGEAVDLLNEYYDELVAQEQALIDAREEADRAAEIEAELQAQREKAAEEAEIAQRLTALRLELFGTEEEQFRARLEEQLALYEEYGLSRRELDEYALSQWQEFNDSQVTDSEEKNEDLIEDDEETQMTQLEMYQQYQDARLEIAEDGIEQEKDATEAFLEWYEDKYIGRVLSAASGLYSALASFASARADAEIAAIERSADSEEEKARKIREIKIRQARADKAAGIFKATIDTANAIVGFLAEPGGVAGIVLSVLAGVAGAAQVGAIAAQPLPAFAMGGDFITNGPQQIMVGDNPGGRERVTVEPLGGDGGGKPMRILVMLDGRQIAGSTVDYINNGVVRVEARA